MYFCFVFNLFFKGTMRKSHDKFIVASSGNLISLVGKSHACYQLGGAG